MNRWRGWGINIDWPFGNEVCQKHSWISEEENKNRFEFWIKKWKSTHRNWFWEGEKGKNKNNSLERRGRKIENDFFGGWENTNKIVEGEREIVNCDLLEKERETEQTWHLGGRKKNTDQKWHLGILGQFQGRGDQECFLRGKESEKQKWLIGERESERASWSRKNQNDLNGKGVQKKWETPNDLGEKQKGTIMILWREEKKRTNWILWREIFFEIERERKKRSKFDFWDKERGKRKQNHLARAG